MKILCDGCKHTFSVGTMGRCPECGGILRPHYADDVIMRLRDIRPGPGIDRYGPLMPVSMALPSLGEGDTPLIGSRRIGPGIGLEHLYFKYEGCNPSGAFKDRGGVLAAALAMASGAEGVLTASSGNAAASISAYSAAAGLKCLILLEPEGPPTKLRQTLATGARVLPVEGVFAHGPEATSDLILEVAARLNYYPAFVWAPVNPYILEGIKTISYEIVHRLPGAADVVVCPVGGGDLLTGQWRGYLELKRAGLIEKPPRMVAVQSLQAPPLLEAFKSDTNRVATLSFANSRISGINVPFTGEHALATVKESGGVVVGVNDDAVFDMQRRLGVEEGLWVEPVSAAPLTALTTLLDQGDIKPDDRIICIMSGAGFKDTHLVQKEAEAVAQRETVPFDVQAIVSHMSH